jgi:hypothetical protein
LLRAVVGAPGPAIIVEIMSMNPLGNFLSQVHHCSVGCCTAVEDHSLCDMTNLRWEYDLRALGRMSEDVGALVVLLEVLCRRFQILFFV